MLKGIDLNSNNWVIDWKNIKDAGIQVVINKATEGNYYKDKYMEYRYEQCKQLGLLYGVYHFAGNDDVITEVNFFIDYIKNLSYDIIPWLDIEDVPSYSWKWTKQTAIKFVNNFIALFKSKINSAIGVYCSQWFYENYLRGNISPDIPLWVADYSTKINPYVLESWQYTNKGTIIGEKGNFDLDLFCENIVINKGEKIITNYDKSIPAESDKIKHFLNSYYVEQGTDGEMRIHLDRYNYLQIRKGKPPVAHWGDETGLIASKEL